MAEQLRGIHAGTVNLAQLPPDSPVEVNVHSACRKRLFNMINELPTVFDIVTGKKQKEKANNATPPNKGPGKSKVRRGGIPCSVGIQPHTSNSCMCGLLAGGQAIATNTSLHF